GHLVLSTLHTNDAISSAMRLVDIGVEGFMAASALRGVLAQRLVRKICAHCTAPYTPNHNEQTWLEQELGLESQALKLQKGAGCSHCNNTGYSGRIGIFELLELDNTMADALRAADTAAFAAAASKSEGFKTLAQSALEYAGQGRITLEEVLRVTAQIIEDTDATLNRSEAQAALIKRVTSFHLEPMEH
ncbi:MAG: MSHA biogenesis protein MshE, partial [Motiliproteus sp.]